jgi:hypothetical protein
MRVQEQQALQSQYGPTQYSQQLAALQQLDPTGTALRTQMGNKISSDLSLGYSLDPELEKQLTSQIRGAEVARGNDLGNDAISAEALYKGAAAQNMYQQRLQNAGNFLNSPTPEQQLVTVQPVTADRASAYIDPNAGLQQQQFGLSAYQDQLARWQLSGGSRNPWSSALAGAGSGALAGSSFGPYGAAAGAVIGGAGGYFSDENLKCNIVRIGTSPSGIPEYEFSYIADPSKRFSGTTAQALLNRGRCDAVSQIGPYYVVNYNVLDVKFRRVA